MSGATNIPAYVPQPNRPFVTDGGRVDREWYYFLLAMFNRTGGSPGIPASIQQEQIIGLQVQSAMADQPDPAPFPVLSMDAVLADIQTAPAFPVLSLDSVLGELPPAPAVNPFLAALLVADP